MVLMKQIKSQYLSSYLQLYYFFTLTVSYSGLTLIWIHITSLLNIGKQRKKENRERHLSREHQTCARSRCRCTIFAKLLIWSEFNLTTYVHEPQLPLFFLRNYRHRDNAWICKLTWRKIVGRAKEVIKTRNVDSLTRTKRDERQHKRLKRLKKTTKNCLVILK